MKSLKNQSITLAACFAMSLGIAVHAQGPVPVEVDEPGANAVAEAQNNPIKAKVKQTAAQQIKAFMHERSYSSGWDENKKRFFVEVEDGFDCANPSGDRDFFIKREMAAKKAILYAKAEIIEFVNTEMSASEQLYVPDTDVNTKLNARLKATEKKLAAQKAVVAKLLNITDKAEAKALEGVTWGDRCKALMDAAIKKLDSKFNAGEIEAKNKARYIAAKKSYLIAINELKALEKQSAQMRGSVVEKFESRMKTIAKMPLLGAMVIAQSESWNSKTKRYEVAVLVCWSTKLERAARAILQGESSYRLAGKNSKKNSIYDWLAKQDLSLMMGPRQYLDANGNRWFLGISARSLPAASSQRRRARNTAGMFARQMAVFSLYADTEAQRAAAQAMVTRNSGEEGARDSQDAVESLAELLTQTFEKRNVKGMQKLEAKTVKHPITGQDIYVVVYGINPSAIGHAKQIDAVNRKTIVPGANGSSASGSTGDAKSQSGMGDADTDDSF